MGGMSQTFSLVCHETKRQVWIGQGWGKMDSLYSGEPETMANLRDFLNDHLGKPLEFVCCDTTSEAVSDYEEQEAHDHPP